jgi:RimJ/RimL family protein N-acetyltransferase
MAKINDQSYKLKDGRTVVIRTTQEIDAEAYLNLAKSIVSEEIYSLTQADELTLTVEQEKSWINSNIENSSHLVMLAEVDGQIVGQLDFSNGHRKRIAHTGEFGMGVHKDFRSMGIGSFLLKTLIEWAKDHPILEKINLSVHQTNERAIATYKKHGFQIEGLRTKDLKYPAGVYVDTVLMGLHL